MDDLTRLLLIELGYDADNAKKAEEDDAIDVLEGKGLVFIDGKVTVEGKLVVDRNKMMLKPKTYEDGIIGDAFLFSPSSVIHHNGQGDIKRSLKKSSYGLGLLEFAPGSSSPYLEFFYGDDNKDNFVGLELQTSLEIPWLYLPRLDLREGINRPFLETLARSSPLQGINGFCILDDKKTLRECWYKGTFGNIDMAIGDEGGESYMLVFNRIGVHKTEQKKALEAAAESNRNITVDNAETFPPRLFNVRVPYQVMPSGVVVEVRKGSGFQIPGYINEVLKRLS